MRSFFSWLRGLSNLSNFASPPFRYRVAPVRALALDNRRRRARRRRRLLSATVLVTLAALPAAARPAADAWTEGMAALQSGDYALAAESFRSGAEADPEEPRWHYMLGVAWTQAGQQAEAVPSLARAVELSRGEDGAAEISYVLALAQSQLLGGDADAALGTLDRDRPAAGAEKLGAWTSLLAATAARLDDPQPALPLLTAALDGVSGQSAAAVHLALGRAHAKAEDAEGAFTHYAAAAAAGEERALRPALDAALAAATALPADNADGRSEWYRRGADVAAGRAPDGLPVETLLVAGELLYLAERTAEAEKRFLHALEAEPTSALAQYQIARCRLAQDDPEGALARLVELDPEAGDELASRIWSARAQALAGLERWQEAAAMYRQAGKSERAAEMDEVAAAIDHNRGVEREAEKCRQRWADILRLRDENRDVEGTAAWAEIDRRAEKVAADCGPEPVRSAAG